MNFNKGEGTKDGKDQENSVSEDFGGIKIQCLLQD